MLEYVNSVTMNMRYSAQHKEMDYLTVEQNKSIMTDLNYLDGQNIGN